MSVVDVDKVDGIGMDEDENTVALMISDHLDWKDEYVHLEILQDKINAYLGFIESGQLQQVYPNKKIKEYVIEIFFQYSVPDSCSRFLKTVADQLEEHNIYIQASYE